MKRTAAVALAVLVAASAEARDLLEGLDLQQPQPRAPKWGLTTAIGFGGAGGDFGDLLRKPD
jgi:hypothetical protein